LILSRRSGFDSRPFRKKRGRDGAPKSEDSWVGATIERFKMLSEVDIREGESAVDRGEKSPLDRRWFL
jgi:hypothetical protein